LESRGSCGGGTIDQRDIAEIATTKKAFVLTTDLEERGVNDPATIKAALVDGNGMANFLVHGDLVLFDTSDKQLHTNQIYAFQMKTGLAIKRAIIRSNGRVILTSDNQDKQLYPDEEYTPDEARELEVIGKFFLLKR
jgi:phage repressor protein C with HTH and peptisase S24 domain